MKKKKRSRRARRARAAQSSITIWHRLGAFCALVVVLTGLAIMILGWLLQRSTQRQLSSQHILLVSNVAETKQPAVLIHVWPQGSKVTAVSFSPDLPLEVPGGYGEYGIRAIYPLLSLDHRNEQEMTSFFSVASGLVVDEVAAAELATYDVTSPASLKTYGRALLLGRIETDLSWWEQMRLGYVLFQLPQYQITTEQVDDEASLESVRSILSKEYPLIQCSVTVINATQVNGLAGMFSDVLDASGVVVVRTTDESQVQVTQILVDEQAPADCGLTLDRIAPTLPIPLTPTPSTNVASRYRANIAIILGSDTAAVLGGAAGQ